MQILINSSSKIPKLLLMEEIRLTTWDEKNLVNNGINYLSTGAGFLPSTWCHVSPRWVTCEDSPTFITHLFDFVLFGKLSERKNGGISHFTIRKPKGTLYRLMMFEINFSNFSTNPFWLFICLLSHFRRSKMPVPQW